MTATDTISPAPRLSLRRSHIVARLFLIALAVAVLLPLISLTVFAFRGDAEIWPHLVNFVLPNATRETALLLAGVAALTAIAGIGTAWLVTAYDFPGRNSLVWLLPLPLAFPTYIVAYVYVDIFDALGPVQSAFRMLFGYRTAAEYWFPSVRSLPGAVIVFSLVLYPYVYLAARTMFLTQSASLIEVARTLGASRLMLARHVALPLARPALAVGLSLALLEALNDIGASEYLGVQTLTLSIFTTWINRSSLPGAAQIACAMLVIVIALMALERHGRRHRRFVTSPRRQRTVPRIALDGRPAWLSAIFCALPFVFGFLLPFFYLAYEVVLRGLITGFDIDLLRYTATTVTLAATATAVAIALGLAAAIAVRIVRGTFATSCLVVAGLGYAIPGTVLALGLLTPLVGIDTILNAVSALVGGPHLGLVIAGSSAALVIAYVIRFLAISTGSAQAGLARISTEIDDVARTLGTKPSRIAWLIHLPLTRPALGSAALLVFVDCLKELPATLLLRPLNVETLSTYIYQFATRGNFEEGSLAALLIVAVGILPVIHLTRFSEIAPAPVPPSSR
ncbi:iron ABC transporter permease [Pseudorhodoplanes sp.]|uniref:ABC transporter permease n=1 Tax=Pseudorhodoplanes sp. TaxID=1934341 RepID=UPI002C0B4E71|nr:iron ABC transporter permease [Pseudorhodoplanes sp.]HWV55721.1 iron ABC transporter permease [Pseudorhodoplanes sp.]